MPKTPSNFKQSDLTRAIRGVLACGLPIYRTEITPEGHIAIYHGTSVEKVVPDATSAYDAWKAHRDAHQA